jgi:uncharacterized membrane protein YhdT
MVFVGMLPLYFIWSSDFLPLTDFPNHIARINILKVYETSAFYRQYFFVDYFNGHLPIPDIIFDLFAVKLMPFLTVQSAGRLFLSLYVLLSIVSVLLLAAETGADREIALLGYLPVVYSLFFNMALLNFIFSIPLFILCLVAFLRYEKSGGPLYLTLLVVLLAVLYISHLFSFFALTVTLMSHFALSRLKRRKVLLALAALSVVTVFLYLSGNVPAFRNYPSWANYKLHLLPLYFLSYPVNYLDYRAGMLILVLYVVGLSWHAATSPLANRGFAVLGMFFFFLYLVLPFSGVSGTMIDARALPFAALMLLVSFGPRVKAGRGAPVILFLIVLALKAYGSFSYYSEFPRNFSRISNCMDRVENGAVLLPVCSMDESNINPYTHAWAYEVLKKEVVTPYFFAGREQPLKYRRPLFAPSSLWGYEKKYDEPPLFWQKVRSTYDYVLVIGDNAKLKNAVAGIGRPVCDTGVASLYRVEDRSAPHAVPYVSTGAAHE